MITVFHGSDTFQTRKLLNHHLDNHSKDNVLRLDKKTINLETINNFLNTVSLLNLTKVLVLEDFFSIPSGKNRKQIEQILKLSLDQIYIWSAKKLTKLQLNCFPQAKIIEFNLNNQLFACVYSLKPGNLKGFYDSYNKIKNGQPFELLLHLIKQNIRKQILTYSQFSKEKLQKTYINLIELDYQSKTGQLPIDKTIGLERIIINLISPDKR